VKLRAFILFLTIFLASAAVNAQSQGKESHFHTVVVGETLSDISEKYYGDRVLYIEIFEANKPMLEDPDKIYPGQVLRIPNISTAYAK